MRWLDIAIKDILQLARDWKALLFLIAMPIGFTVFMGFAFGSGTAAQDPRPVIAILDRDISPMSIALRDLLGGSTSIRLADHVPADSTAAAEDVRSQKIAAAVVIPAGFGAKVLEGNPPALQLVADTSSQAGQAGEQALRAALLRLNISAVIARSAAQEEESRKPYTDGGQKSSVIESAALLAMDGWSKPAFTIQTQSGAKPIAGSTLGQNPYRRTSPGMMVQFVVFGLTASATILTEERRRRTLSRMLATTMNRAEIVLGHMAGMFAIVMMQEAILVGFGQFVLGVDYLREPIAIFLLMATMALWITGMGMFIGAIAKSDDQSVLFALLAMFLFSALGGAWFPLEVSGKVFSTIGHFTPGAWAMDGMQNIILRGLGLESILLPAGILFLFGLVFSGLATWRLSREG